jgi:hypothetical protein
MTTNSYTVYDVDTGEVVHLHVEPAGLNTSAEEIIHLAGAFGSRRLGVVQVPTDGAPADALQVVDGQLLPADKDVGTGAGGGGAGVVEPTVPRRYEFRARRDDDDATERGR